ncbi:MAG: hypothetical protein ACRCTE_13790 [Cellulosilyticaceae bacterium]
MGVIDIACEASMTFTDSSMCPILSDIGFGVKNGITYWSYIYFNLNSLPEDIEIVVATITLFKLEKSSWCSEQRGTYHYCAVPTLDYVTPYSYCYEAPKLAEMYREYFAVNEESAYTEIDITLILNEWMNGMLDNKGLMFNADLCGQLQIYGGENLCEQSLRPFLRIKYKKSSIPSPDIHPPMIPLPLKVSIK